MDGNEKTTVLILLNPFIIRGGNMYGYFLKKHNIRKVIIIKIFSRRKTLPVTCVTSGMVVIKPDKHFRQTL